MKSIIRFLKSGVVYRNSKLYGVITPERFIGAWLLKRPSPRSFGKLVAALRTTFLHGLKLTGSKTLNTNDWNQEVSRILAIPFIATEKAAALDDPLVT